MYDNIIIPAKAKEQPIRVILLADEDNSPEYLDYVTKMAGGMIAAAAENRMAVMVCKHADSDKKSVVLCATHTSPDGHSISYIPLAQLFDSEWAPWQQMTPPNCALPNEPQLPETA